MAEGVKIAARNQKAFHEYFIDEKFEAGIELTGTEVKSIRLGTLSLKEAWCQIKDGQLFIRQMHIAPYEQGNIFNKDPLRPRRLLMHKREIQRLASKAVSSRSRLRLQGAKSSTTSVTTPQRRTLSARSTAQ